MAEPPIAEDFAAIAQGLARVRREPGKVNTHRTPVQSMVRLVKMPPLLGWAANVFHSLSVGQTGKLIGYAEGQPDLAKVAFHQGVIYLAPEHYEALPESPSTFATHT